MAAGLAGTWALVAEEARGADGAPAALLYGGAPLGSVTFTAEGCFAAVLCDGRPAPGGEGRAMLGFSGRWTLAGTALTLLPEAASRPALVGAPQRREVTLEGNHLVLTALAPDGSTRRFTWQRLSPVI